MKRWKVVNYRSNILARILSKIKDKRSLVAFNRVYEKIILFMYRKKAWFIVVLVLSFGLPVFLLPDKIEKKTEKRLFYHK